jgi:SRSO17 transposase
MKINLIRIRDTEKVSKKNHDSKDNKIRSMRVQKNVKKRRREATTYKERIQERKKSGNEEKLKNENIHGELTPPQVGNCLAYNIHFSIK